MTSKARIHYINNDLLYCNGCYAGYCDYMLPLCYPSHTCNKYNPIKPIGYPPKVIPPIEPPIENSTRLVYDNYYGAGYVQGKENAILVVTTIITYKHQKNRAATTFCSEAAHD
ncbi:MAG: hypothetical protein WA323_04820 [Candidatus Nitrosopolaris sp.]